MVPAVGGLQCWVSRSLISVKKTSEAHCGPGICDKGIGDGSRTERDGGYREVFRERANPNHPGDLIKPIFENKSHHLPHHEEKILL